MVLVDVNVLVMVMVVIFVDVIFVVDFVVVDFVVIEFVLIDIVSDTLVSLGSNSFSPFFKSLSMVLKFGSKYRNSYVEG